jgi:hypothetical protein
MQWNDLLRDKQRCLDQGKPNMYRTARGLGNRCTESEAWEF